MGYLVIAVRTKRGDRAAIDCVGAPPETSSKCKLERSTKRRESEDKRRERGKTETGISNGGLTDRRCMAVDRERALRYLLRMNGGATAIRTMYGAT